jgi:lipoprotein-anchoring transpeptidase ErfK/SrfK
MTRAEATATIKDEAARYLGGSITVSAGGKAWNVTRAKLGHHAAVLQAINRAFAVSESMGTFERFLHRFRDEPVRRWIPLRYSGESRVVGFVRSVAEQVAKSPVNAAIDLQDGSLSFVHERVGRALKTSLAVSLLRDALVSGASRAQLPVGRVKPEVTGASLGTTIVVRVDENRLDLYQGFDVVRSYSVATAKPGWVTPVGEWGLVRKAENPTWYNPALDTWGADLPAVIPGGPGNPMGTRALYLNAPGLIRIHGTPDPSSVGRYASHGCIRMYNSQVEELYDLVPVGSEVIIVGYRPASAQEWDTPASADI